MYLQKKLVKYQKRAVIGFKNKYLKHKHMVYMLKGVKNAPYYIMYVFVEKVGEIPKKSSIRIGKNNPKNIC